MEISFNGKKNTCGLSGFMSWARFERILHEAGELLWYEKIINVEVSEKGITYMIKDSRNDKEQLRYVN